ncbi:hypothetical protein D9619_013362 [Psilocybe cf. subviscida]|uniref:Uncharacterized protein n=1 Tax=Psilocybe cf. subviscida TaxID=2480587 RepID=A0A8H5BSD6_9AGAR|nr:hypothetical protein D9619_013362 [Psilocybe cf. subviscida]
MLLTPPQIRRGASFPQMYTGRASMESPNIGARVVDHSQRTTTVPELDPHLHVVKKRRRWRFEEREEGSCWCCGSVRTPTALDTSTTATGPKPSASISGGVDSPEFLSLSDPATANWARVSADRKTTVVPITATVGSQRKIESAAQTEKNYASHSVDTDNAETLEEGNDDAHHPYMLSVRANGAPADNCHTVVEKLRPELRKTGVDNINLLLHSAAPLPRTYYASCSLACFLVLTTTDSTDLSMSPVSMN